MFLLIFILSSSIIMAKVNDPVKNVTEMCIESRDWTNEKCEYIEKQEYIISRFDPYFDDLVDFSSQTREAFGALSDLAKWLIGTTPSRGVVNKTEIENSIKTKIKQDGLNSCQQACLIKCASANILDYNYSRSTKYSSVKTIYEQGEGVCTEFSRVYDHLAAAIGINSETIANFKQRHSYNKVKIDGKWYYAEPQKPGCEFIKIAADNALGEKLDGDMNGVNFNNSQRDQGKVVEVEELKPLSIPNSTTRQ